MGPARPSTCTPASGLEETFRGWELLRLDAYDAEISEGAGHAGMSALIDLVARKPG